jgi:hypothetical protein
VTVEAPGLLSDLYVALSGMETYAATHGRQEFVERYPAPTRAVMAALGGALALRGRTLPAFRRDQYVYQRADNRSHLLLVNLSNVTSRIRVVVDDGGGGSARLLTVPPMGSHLLDVAAVSEPTAGGARVLRVRLEANAWFNLYVVGAGPRDLAGPLSLMHVK